MRKQPADNQQVWTLLSGITIAWRAHYDKISSQCNVSDVHQRQRETCGEIAHVCHAENLRILTNRCTVYARRHVITFTFSASYRLRRAYEAGKELLYMPANHDACRSSKKTADEKYTLPWANGRISTERQDSRTIHECATIQYMHIWSQRIK